MQSQFKASYQRVEASLIKLSESIAAYNPSTLAADELLAADEQVNENLTQLIKHQQNHLRIQELRRTAESLDETIKNTVKLLADARKEIQAIPSSEPAEPRHDINVDELLSYAKFISRTTVPPTFRKPIPDSLLPKPTKPDITSDIVAANGATTPTNGEQDGDNKHTPAKPETAGGKATDAKDQASLDAAAALPFEPWPSLGVIQGSALAELQRMVESGKDPASVLSAEEQAELDLKKKEEEERERLEEEERIRRRMSMFDTARRRTVAEDEVFNPDDL